MLNTRNQVVFFKTLHIKIHLIFVLNTDEIKIYTLTDTEKN